MFFLVAGIICTILWEWTRKLHIMYNIMDLLLDMELVTNDKICKATKDMKLKSRASLPV